MSVDDDILAYHTNTQKYGIEYPDEVEFGERFRPGPEHAYIDPKRYTSSEFLQEEFESLWPRTWQMACREEQVPNPGDYIEYVIGRQSYLVIRGEDGTLRAFNNACKHRGKLLKTGSGSAREIRCGYHGWCWSLKGGLTDVPDRQLFPELDSSYDLDEVACDSWGGFVFIHPRPETAQPLREYLEPLASEVDKYNFDKFRIVMHAELEIPANWKASLEAFLEAYHVSATHPQIMAYLDDVNTAFTDLGKHALMIVPYGVPSMRLEHVDAAEIYESYYSKSATAFRHKESGQAGGTAPAPEGTMDLPSELFDADGEWTPDSSVREYLIEKNREKGDELGHDYSELSDPQMVDDYDYHIFPNFKFNAHAGGAIAFRSRPHVTDPNMCVFDIYKLIWDDQADEPQEAAPTIRVDYAEQSMGQVLDQDLRNLPEIQRGMHSDSLRRLTLGGSEMRVVHFQANLMRELAAARAERESGSAR